MPDIYTAGLLNTIAKAESNGNYNAYFGNANNSSVQFTAMSVEEVMGWQKEFVLKGSPSSAVGRYQFIDSTLASLVQQLSIDTSVRFDQQLQDRLAVALLQRRGLNDYVNNKMSREEFAHNLSKEWAALPVVIGEQPQISYYADDGLNAARLSVQEIISGIDTVYEL